MGLAARGADMCQEVEYFLFGDRDRGGKGGQAYVDRLGIGPDQMREHTGDERAAHRGKKGILGAPRRGRLRRRLVVNPRHDAAGMQFSLGMRDIDPAEVIEAADIRFAAILVGDADMHDMFALPPQCGIQHRAEFGRGIKDHVAAAPGQSG
jgi:hypothetical protein